MLCLLIDHQGRWAYPWGSGGQWARPAVLSITDSQKPAQEASQMLASCWANVSDYSTARCLVLLENRKHYVSIGLTCGVFAVWDTSCSLSNGRRVVFVHTNVNRRRILTESLPSKHTRHLTNVSLMLAHRLRRWPNIKQTLVQCIILAG